MADIEDAERLCVAWNNFKFSDINYLRVHLHPYCCRKRPTNKLSIHPVFKNNFQGDPIPVPAATQSIEAAKYIVPVKPSVVKQLVQPQQMVESKKD